MMLPDKYVELCSRAIGEELHMMDGTSMSIVRHTILVMITSFAMSYGFVTEDSDSNIVNFILRELLYYAMDHGIDLYGDDLLANMVYEVELDDIDGIE